MRRIYLRTLILLSRLHYYPFLLQASRSDQDMPHLFIPLRPRKYALGMGKDDPTDRHPILGFLQSEKFWEAFNVWIYLKAGCWLFIIASILWLIVSLHDAAELSFFHRHLLIHPNGMEIAIITSPSSSIY